MCPTTKIGPHEVSPPSPFQIQCHYCACHRLPCANELLRMPPSSSHATPHQTPVLAMLVLLSLISYVDRVCISIAGSTIAAELSLSPSQLGWVFGVFIAGYGIGELPSGILVDHCGPHSVLTRIVLWWSLFTVATGLVPG